MIIDPNVIEMLKTIQHNQDTLAIITLVCANVLLLFILIFAKWD